MLKAYIAEDYAINYITKNWRKNEKEIIVNGIDVFNTFRSSL